ncbi:Rad4p [Saccharomyces cerevisiae YJM1273]|nr:Rad4p [Saccharomyces cerevisiae YJM1273]AJU53102.1 Rad4p [Saccharomyces cerevisiae YJM1434]CAI4426511.1 AVI_1a_G0016000.mRNA.1.CDS.1 [Saccharomyces cerevisiae]CAI4446804.1 ANE_G0016040.mRNA.1.CDS.1 [Saccharomyces cerevisiae]CAI6634648.1 ANE_G0016040.mRNA.1.CDS.1 [Saccharomyces cerevisiae]
MNEDLPKEYFELIRKALNEKEAEKAPLSRRRRVRRKNQPLPDAKKKFKTGLNELPRESVVTVNLDSSDDGVVTVPTDDSVEEIQSSEEDYDSEEFEDVTDGNEVAGVEDISVEIKPSSKRNSDARRTSRNVCSNEERKRRKYFHMLYLVCLMVHGFIRNEWINSKRLSRKLSNLVPEKVFELLHPQKDEELPLRSTRKLLDGLKKCMELWQKHWKITKKYDNVGLYMRTWKEIEMSVNNKRNFKTLKRSDFLRAVSKGHGDPDISVQGFVAMLRACNVNARLIMSCQPPDFTNMKIDTSLNGNNAYKDMVKYPIFWCEVWDKFSKKWITVDPVNLKTIEQVRLHSKLAPKGVACCERNMLRYVIAYDRKYGCRDVTRRYAQWMNSKVRKRRITKDEFGEKWFRKVITALHHRKRTKIDDYEDQYFFQRDESEGIPDSVQDLKNHPYYVLEQDIKQTQIVKPGCKECGYLKVHGKVGKVLKVYAKRDIADLKSARQWYMNGRILKTGSRCKKVIKRTVGRPKGEAEEEEERLYSFEDTELYIPPLASASGEITKNTFGNIEVFAPTMIPGNCCLVENPVAIKAARFLGVEFAPAVTSFKFERGSTVKPVLSGIVVAKWLREAIETAIDGIEFIQEDDSRKEHLLGALESWNTLLLKLRIRSKLNSTYGKIAEEEPNVTKEQNTADNHDNTETFMGGGFLPGIANQEARPYSEPSEPEDSLDYVSVDKAEESATDDDVGEDYSDFMKELEMSEESD